MTSRFVLRLTLLMAALCVAVPATAFVVRVTVYFSANFNSAGAPGSGISAEVGVMSESGPPGVFTVVPGPSGGQLRIADGGLATDAALSAHLKQVYKGSQVTIGFKLTCSQTSSGMTLRAEDDSDSGMIDVGFVGGGDITVDGENTGGEYEENATYDGELRLRDALVGSSTWSLVLKSDTGEVISLQGLMKSNAPLRVEELQIIRSFGQAPGEFFVDDLKVSSTSFLPSY